MRDMAKQVAEDVEGGRIHYGVTGPDIEPLA